MARSDKAATVAELTDKFRESGAAVLTEYRGLTVAQLTQLRRAISANATYAVVKNTLTELAAKEAGVTAFDGQLAGPTAIAFITGDAVETAKGLRDFAKTHPALVIKGGYLDGKPLTAGEITQLADLESREVLLAKLAGAMKASLTQGRLPLRRTAVADWRGSSRRCARSVRSRAVPPAAPARPTRRRPSGRRRPPRLSRRRRGCRRDRSRGRPLTPAAEPARSGLTSHRRRTTHQPQTQHQTERTPPWRSSAPTSCSTRSRK